MSFFKNLFKGDVSSSSGPEVPTSVSSEEAFKHVVDDVCSYYSGWWQDKTFRRGAEESFDQMLTLVGASLDQQYSPSCYAYVYQSIMHLEGQIEAVEKNKRCKEIRAKLGQLLYDAQKALPDDARKKALLEYGHYLTREGLEGEVILWLESMYAKATQNADPKERLLRLQEYIQIYYAMDAYDPAKKLYLAYLPYLREMEDKKQASDELQKIYYFFFFGDRYEDMALFYGELLIHDAQWYKDTKSSEALGYLRNHLYELGGSRIKDKALVTYFSQPLEAFENFIRTNKDVCFPVLMECYGRSHRKIISKRAIALAKELNFGEEYINDLRDFMNGHR